VLKEYGEMNYKEIGRALGISEGNVKVRVFRARERLTGIFAEKAKLAEEAEMQNIAASAAKDGI
jgi:RNA polymerase sigma-70 factor (ECF subfamily)